MNLQEFYSCVDGNYDNIMMRFGSEEMVLKYLEKFLHDGTFNCLEVSLAHDDLEQAFQSAHSLKGLCLNFSLKRLLECFFDLTEALRARQNNDDIVPLFTFAKAEYEQTIAFIQKLMHDASSLEERGENL